MALPTSENPFVLDRKEVGDGFPPHLYGSRFNRFTFGASAEAFVVVPVIGETKLGGAYVIYEYPGYVAFGGGYDATVLDLVGIRGGISAEADVEQGVFDIHGEVKACLYLADLDLCSGATGHVSRGRGGTGGGGACVDLGLVTVGGGVRWNDLERPVHLAHRRVQVVAVPGPGAPERERGSAQGQRAEGQRDPARARQRQPRGAGPREPGRRQPGGHLHDQGREGQAQPRAAPGRNRHRAGDPRERPGRRP